MIRQFGTPPLREQLQERVCFPHRVERHLRGLQLSFESANLSLELGILGALGLAPRTQVATESCKRSQVARLAPLRDAARVDTLAPAQHSLGARHSRRLVLDQNLTLLLGAEGPALRRGCQVDLLTHSTIIEPPPSAGS